MFIGSIEKNQKITVKKFIFVKGTIGLRNSKDIDKLLTIFVSITIYLLILFIINNLIVYYKR